MRNINNSLFTVLLIQTISFSLISSSIIIGNPTVIYAKESPPEKSSGVDASNNNNNNNPSPQLSTTPTQDCNSSQNNSACQEQHQLPIKQQPNQQQPQPKPDNSCLFHPEQTKCKPDPITHKCPQGFSLNVNQHCYPNKPCPKGFERHEDDETGTCYPIHKPIST